MEVQKQALEGYSSLAGSATGLEKIKAEKRRDELTTAVAAAPGGKGMPRIRASDMPEFSAGMAGRILLDGKDAATFVTYNPGRMMDPNKQLKLMQTSNATQGRMIVEGIVSCPTPMVINVFHAGEIGKPPQLLSIDGREVSTVGGNTGRNVSSQVLQLPAGDHLVQWVCDFNATVASRISLVDDSRGTAVPIRYSRKQAVAAKKGTKSEISISD